MTEKKSDILIIEDTDSIAMVFRSWLKKQGLAADVASDGAIGLEKLRTGRYRLALLDLDLPELSGSEILKQAAAENIETIFVVVTASGSVGTAINAMRLGAYDFVVKPTSEERLVTTARNALDHGTLTKTIRKFCNATPRKAIAGFVGSSLPMQTLYREIESIAQSKASVFITGESGTGKEICAEAIHAASPRNGGPFIPVNCAAIPKDLMESEIFGHVSGAFTGATSNRSGAVSSAHGGTLFLDELCEMDLNLQSKLLRFIQTGTVQKIGSDNLETVDVRIVCATNRDPVTEVREGRFREDLFYRLHVLPIYLPPLRERGTDAVEIAEYLLKEMSEEEGKNFKSFSEDAQDRLLSHDWPGNIRELQNVIRKAVILSEGEEMNARMLSLEFSDSSIRRLTPERIHHGANGGKSICINLEQPFALIEREIMEAAISHCSNSIPKASEMLGLSPSTIYRKKENWD